MNYSKTQLKELRIGDIQRLAGKEGIQVPSSLGKAEQIARFLDLLAAKTEPEPQPTETVITLDCGHPLSVQHLQMPAPELKAHLRAAKQAAVCPRCPAAIAEPKPEGEDSAAGEPSTPPPARAEPSSANTEASIAIEDPGEGSGLLPGRPESPLDRPAEAPGPPGPEAPERLGDGGGRACPDRRPRRPGPAFTAGRAHSGGSEGS